MRDKGKDAFDDVKLHRNWRQVKQDCIQLTIFRDRLQFHQNGLTVQSPSVILANFPSLEQLLMKGVAFNQHLQSHNHGSRKRHDIHTHGKHFPDH
jgi:hypothetical protein